MNKKFFWRTVICVLPILLSGWVTGVAWWNYRTDSPTGLKFNLGVDLAGGTILVYQVDEDWWNNPANEDQRASFSSADLAAALKRRIDPNNLMEITIRPVTSKVPRVELVLPMRSAGAGKQGVGDIERIKTLIGQVGKLEFRILADTRPSEYGDDRQAIEDAKTLVDTFVPTEKNVPSAPEGYTWFLIADGEVKRRGYDDKSPKGMQQDTRESTQAVYHAPEFNRHFLLTRNPPDYATVTGEDLAGARKDFQDAQMVVQFSLKSSSAHKFSELTRPVKYYMAIILDGKIESAPVLQSRLSDGGIITMGADENIEKKVEDLVRILRAGALPATLSRTPVSEQSMGPGLGQDTIDKGTVAVIIGFFAVVTFMIVYYRFAGLVASVALFANLLMTIAFMVLVKATFTLPGLAGLVLMVGMAVDANVLIYERIREERERGAGLALAIRNGYDRALPTIIDTHLTSIFTAIVLYVVGNDQLKGFGVSLTAGLIISLFTSLYMTRLLFDAFLAINWLKQLRMMKMMARPNIDFMRVRNYWFTATVLLSIFGVIIFVLRGEAGLNIDFTGGTAYSIQFKESKPIQQVRDRITKHEELSKHDPSVDALFAQEDAGKRETSRFTIRATLKQPEKVQKIVADIFGDELVWVEVKAGPIQPVEKEKLNRRVTLEFTNYGITRAEVGRVVDKWLADKGVSKPDDFYEVTGVGEKDKNDLYSRVQLDFAVPDTTKSEELVGHLTAKGGPLYQPKSERKEVFDSQLAGKIQGQALAAIALSWLAVSLYLWFRFGNWTFGIAAVLCLIHDLMFAIGLIGLSHYLTVYTPIGGWLLLGDFKLDLAAVAALLTLVGYSVNDTIVVFDRIREVRGKSPELTPQMINDSINQTLSRTLLTGISTFLVVIVLYIFGGEGVHLFSYIMIVGVIIGTYSSIYVASPLLLIFGEGRPLEKKARERGQPQGARV